MALPTINVRVAFASDPFDAAPIWTDIEADVYRILIRRGRNHELDRMEAGTARIQLNNLKGDFWPNNASGPYYPNIKPGKQVKVRAQYNLNFYHLFTGFVRKWPPLYRASQGQLPYIDIQCDDLLRNLARYDLNDAVGYGQELSGTRVDNVLDDIGWPVAARDLDAGQSQMQATGALANLKARQHLQDVEQSELGIVFIAGDGDVQFQDRHYRLLNKRTSAAVFGDDIGENFYHDLELDFGDDYIYNDIRLTRTGGTQQTASDGTSQTEYGPRTLSRTSLQNITDIEIASQANYLLRQYKDPHIRAGTLTIKGERAPDALWPKLLGYEISERITLRRNEASIDADYHIEGITHDIDLRNQTWKTQWQLSDADAMQYWVLNIPGFSEINETTILAY